MEIADVVKRAYAMPLTNPSFPPGPYRFFDREYIIITYRTTREALEAVVPAPLEIDEPLVKYEFIRMPDSTGFGDYTETGQVIPVRYKGQHGGYVHSMFLDDDAPIAGGRELWGFPKKLANPKIVHEGEVIVGTLHYGSVLCATGTMGYKHHEADHDQVLASLAAPNFLIKIIPHVDGTPAHLRVGPLLPHRHHAEGSLDGSGRARSAAPRHGRRGEAARARHRVGGPLQSRSDARPGRSRA